MITFAFTIRASSYISIVFYFAFMKTAEKQPLHIVRDKSVFFNADSLKILYILLFYPVMADALSEEPENFMTARKFFFPGNRIFPVHSAQADRRRRNLPLPHILHRGSPFFPNGWD